MSVCVYSENSISLSGADQKLAEGMMIISVEEWKKSQDQDKYDCFVADVQE